MEALSIIGSLSVRSATVAPDNRFSRPLALPPDLGLLQRRDQLPQRAASPTHF
jgi:hypothetical protein